MRWPKPMGNQITVTVTGELAEKVTAFMQQSGLSEQEAVEALLERGLGPKNVTQTVSGSVGTLTQADTIGNITFGGRPGAS